MIRWRTIIALLLCLSLIGLTACNPFGDDEETTQQLVEVARGDLIVSVSGSGNIEASREARLSFGSGGRIDRIHVEEGDEVSQGEVLAELDTDALELAKTQAEVALTQAQLARTQAQLSQQTTEYELKNIRDTKDALELTLFNAQINLDQAKYNLEQVQDLYTWSDIKIAQADVDESERYLEYCLEQLYKYLPVTEEGTYPKIEEDFPKIEGYEVWQERIVHAQSRLNAAKDRLDAMLSGSDIKEVAIKKNQVLSAEMALAQAEKNLDELAEEVAIKELQVEFAKDSVEQARQSVKLAQQSLEEAQKNLDEATITALFDGVVATVEAKEGDIIPPPTMAAKTVIYLVDLSSMELIVELDEIDIPEVKLNQEAIIELDALPDITFKGIVTAIYPLPTTEGGVVLYNVKINLDIPENSAVRIGMSAEADIIIDKRSNVLLVPDRAIEANSQGNPVVKVMVNDQIQERQVVTGISDGLETEIVDGLNEGEIVLVERRAK